MVCDTIGLRRHDDYCDDRFGKNVVTRLFDGVSFCKHVFSLWHFVFMGQNRIVANDVIKINHRGHKQWKGQF